MTGERPANLKRWLTERFIPTWAERVVLPGSPGYVEYLTPDFAPDRRPIRTTLVAARLAYVFSHAQCLDPKGDWIAVAERGVDFLLDRCAAGNGAFCHSVMPDGSPIDGRCDLYDLAFVLFAMAWFHRATGDARTLEAADRAMSFIERRLADPRGGFLEDTLGTLPRRQNPHMHLLEACHALAEASGEEVWLDRAERLVTLLTQAFFDAETGSLGEFFDARWRPAEGSAGQHREPGHHFEWVWLLHHHMRLTRDRSLLETAKRLDAFGLAHGMDQGFVLDEVNRQGAVIAPTRLLWPQTEAIKAAVARIEFLGDEGARGRLDSHLDLLFRHYLDAETGLWRNQLSAEGEPIRAEVPLRVLYHLMLALAEVVRIEAFP